MYLWSNIVWSAAECGGHHPIDDPLLTHAKVGDLDVAFCIKHDVVQLKVPIDDPMSVEVLESKCDLCRIEASPSFVKLSCPLYLEHQITSVDVFHHKEEPDKK